MRMAPLAIALALLCGGPGLAQGTPGPKCGSFALQYTNDSRTFVDHGPEGKSPGDQRVAKGTLTDRSGNNVGSLYAVTTLLPGPGPEGQDLTLGNLIHEFPNGTISSVGLVPFAAADESRPPDKPTAYAVTGGTGAFARATGQVTGATLDDGTRELSYDLTCG